MERETDGLVGYDLLGVNWLGVDIESEFSVPLVLLHWVESWIAYWGMRETLATTLHVSNAALVKRTLTQFSK